jgi:hypothetical protein
MKAVEEMKDITKNIDATFVTLEQYKASQCSGVTPQLCAKVERDFEKHDLNHDEKLDIEELSKHEALWGVNKKGDYVSEELEYILNRLTGDVHHADGPTPMHYTDITVTLADAKKHSVFFVGYHTDLVGQE